jgi:hypothetical protein
VKPFAPALALGLLAAVPSVSAIPSAAQLLAAGDFNAAGPAYAAALAANPDDAGAQLGLGAIRLYENDITGAEPLLRAVVEKDPANARAIRLLAELDRRKAERSRRTFVEGATSTVPFVTADPLPVVGLKANGRMGTFLVDTGGTLDLDPAFAANLGLTLQDAGTGTFAGGKQASIKRSMLQSVSLGTATAFDVPVHVLETHASSAFAGLHLDGVVGTTLFERFLVTIDYPMKRLVVRPRSASAQFMAAAKASDATIVQCWLVGDHFVFADARVNAAPEGLFLFDSGLAGGGLMPSEPLVKAANLELDRSRAGTGIGGGGEVAMIPFVARAVAVGSAAQYDVPGLYTPGNSLPFPFTVWGIVSNDFLKHYAYTVDFDAMKIVLQPSS